MQVLITLSSTLQQTLCSLLQERGRSPQLPGLHKTAMLMPNCCVLATGPSDQTVSLLIELKPKSGVLPTSAAIPPEHSIKKQMSRFQLMHRIKVAQVSTLPPELTILTLQASLDLLTTECRFTIDEQQHHN